MNLIQFLREVDKLSDISSHEALKRFIHEIARILPEDKRETFVGMLRASEICADSESAAGQCVSRESAVGKCVDPESTAGSCVSSGSAAGSCMGKRNEASETAELVEKLQEKLTEIDEGERCLESEYNEEYDDWYNSDVPEMLFSDSEDVLKDVNQAMELIHRCVDTEAYQAGCELAERLSAMEIFTRGEYDDDVLTMRDLFSYDLLGCDFKHFLKECLYLTYMGNSPEDRADALFCIMGNFECYDIRLEDILQTGNEELPEFTEFLSSWIDFLGHKEGRNAEKFLQEAQLMLQDEEILLDNARKFAEVHPSLYEQYLQMKIDSGEDEKLLAVGEEAMQKIPKSCRIRSHVALLSGTCACRLKKVHLAEQCWLEAFRSDSSVTNYFRLRFQTKDWLNYAGEVQKIYEQVYKHTAGKNRTGFYNRDSQNENLVSRNAYCIMNFFDGRFDRVLAVGMSEKEALGWSETFMKQGLALFLLLFYQGDPEKKLPSGLQDMLRRAVSACEFDVKEYFQGTDICQQGDKQEVFRELFHRWKSSVKITEKEQNTWLDRIERWISFRVAGIMEKNRRNYYGECASFIAAFGEVQESMGNPLAKSAIMERYKREYSRRRAFHQELRNYGMK